LKKEERWRLQRVQMVGTDSLNALPLSRKWVRALPEGLKGQKAK